MKSIKKTIIALTFIFAILASSITTSAQTIDYSVTGMYMDFSFTISNTLYPVYARCYPSKLDTPVYENAVVAKNVYKTEGYYDLFISHQNTTLDSDYTEAVRLLTATAYYNCHSYAWHSQNTSTNEFWIDDPANYYAAGSGYVEVETPQVGDIICYFDDKGTSLTSDDENMHSGIVKSVLSTTKSESPGEECIVESKWGAGGLYRHNGFECPYTRYIGIHEDDADYVKYYRRSVPHQHDYVYTNVNNYEYHLTECNGCNLSIHEAHTFRPERSSSILGSDSINYVPYSRCIYCDFRILSSMA